MFSVSFSAKFLNKRQTSVRVIKAGRDEPRDDDDCPDRVVLDPEAGAHLRGRGADPRGERGGAFLFYFLLYLL